MLLSKQLIVFYSPRRHEEHEVFFYVSLVVILFSDRYFVSADDKIRDSGRDAKIQQTAMPLRNGHEIT